MNAGHTKILILFFNLSLIFLPYNRKRKVKKGAVQMDRIMELIISVTVAAIAAAFSGIFG
jgi:uncharacterized membrane protein